jgi:hypothetical protein
LVSSLCEAILGQENGRHYHPTNLLNKSALRISGGGGEMGRKKHHHPKRSPKRSDLLKKNEATKGKSTFM